VTTSVNLAFGSHAMSTENNNVPQELYDAVDKFIDLANELGTGVAAL